jgi:hypothetical protein
MELLPSSTPTLNAPIVHIMLYYILLSVSAHVGARRHRHQGIFYLNFRFSGQQLAINTYAEIEHLNVRLPEDGAEVRRNA